MEVFKYLGRLIAFDNKDTQAVRGNLAKAHSVCARISRVLQAENASARVCGMFYKATVQSVLFFGSKILIVVARHAEATRGLSRKSRA